MRLRESRSRASLDVPLLPTTPVMFIGIVMILLATIHLFGLLAALDQGDQRGMRKVAASLIREALTGNIAAVKEIADRIDKRGCASARLDGWSMLLARGL